MYSSYVCTATCGNTMSNHCLYVVLEFLIKATMQSAKGHMENSEYQNSPDQPEQHYFCESCHMLSFWLLHYNKVIIYMLTNYISRLPLCVFSRCRAVSFVTEDKSRCKCLLELISI